MKRLSLLFMLAGILLAIGLVFAFGARHVLEAMLSVGWAGFAAFVVAQLGLDFILALAWRLIVPDAQPGLLPRLYWGRMVREAGGRFLPFLPVGGFVIGARAVSLVGVPMAVCAASTLVDVAAEFAAEVVFAALGLVILLTARPQSELILPLGAGIAVAGLAAAIFIALPGHGTRLIRRLAQRIGAAEGRALGSLDDMSLQFDAIYARKGAIIGAVMLHFIAWLGSGLLSWLAYRLLGAPITILQALAIEALLRAALTMTFFIPGNAGVQEAAFAALGALFGFPAQISVAVSLLTRARDLVIGLPALLLWQWLELRGLRSGRPRLAQSQTEP
ncbi:lysylphosphatidylglycerol synthase domain-containing protein [Acidisoma sp. C75]